MNLCVFGNRLLVLCDAVEERKIGSIIIADNHSERSRLATVLKTGKDVRNYAVGDKVLISWYTGIHLHILGEKIAGIDVDEDRHRILREDEILAKVD